MPIDWAGVVKDLILITFGALLSGLSGDFVGRRATDTQLMMAREERRFDVGREAYKAAMGAIDRARKMAFRLAPPAEIHEFAADLTLRIEDARVILGLPGLKEKRLELYDACEEFFGWFSGPRSADDFDVKMKRFISATNQYEFELTEAWQSIIEGELSNRKPREFIPFLMATTEGRMKRPTCDAVTFARQ